MLNLPAALATPVVVEGRVVAKVMLDLTVYLAGPNEQELEYLVDWYERRCPSDRLVKYSIAEIMVWSRLEHAHLTASARASAATGDRRPYLEPVRRRIREGRAFDLMFWDGRRIEDPHGSWSFSCRRIHLRRSGLHAFVRLLVPLSTDPALLAEAAGEVAEHVAFRSGHGGMVFVYDPWRKTSALDAIYALARRYWGIDVEDLNGTLPLTADRIKGVNWLTLVGNRVSSAGAIDIESLAHHPGIRVEHHKQGSVIVTGPEPVAGDQNRPDDSLQPYYAVAEALRPAFLTDHPDFPSERFIANGNTVGWIRRFIEPDGWR
jgi:hypothetical protein